MRQLKLTMEPHVVVLCPVIRNLADCSVHYAVLQNRVYYECGSLLEAIDVCLKASFVFNLQYSAAANSSWLYIQKAVYGIDTDMDNNPAKVMALISDTK